MHVIIQTRRELKMIFGFGDVHIMGQLGQSFSKMVEIKSDLTDVKRKWEEKY